VIFSPFFSHNSGGFFGGWFFCFPLCLFRGGKKKPWLFGFPPFFFLVKNFLGKNGPRSPQFVCIGFFSVFFFPKTQFFLFFFPFFGDRFCPTQPPRVLPFWWIFSPKNVLFFPLPRHCCPLAPFFAVFCKAKKTFCFPFNPPPLRCFGIVLLFPWFPVFGGWGGGFVFRGDPSQHFRGGAWGAPLFNCSFLLPVWGVPPFFPPGFFTHIHLGVKKPVFCGWFFWVHRGIFGSPPFFFFRKKGGPFFRGSPIGFFFWRFCGGDGVQFGFNWPCFFPLGFNDTFFSLPRAPKTPPPLDPFFLAGPLWTLDWVGFFFFLFFLVRRGFVFHIPSAPFRGVFFGCSVWCIKKTNPILILFFFPPPPPPPNFFGWGVGG